MTATSQRQTFFRTYKFRAHEKDPVIDMLRSAMDETGYTVTELHRETGVAMSTFTNWFDGPTRMPSHCRVAAALGAMGKEFAVVDSRRHANGHALDAAAPKFIKKFRSLPARA